MAVSKFLLNDVCTCFYMYSQPSAQAKKKYVTTQCRSSPNARHCPFMQHGNIGRHYTRYEITTTGRCAMVLQIVILCGQIGIKYTRKGNNSDIFKDKHSKRLHILHIAITNLYISVVMDSYIYWFCYNPRFKTNRHSKKTWPLLGEQILVNFSLCPVNFFAKRIRFLSHLVFV